MKAIVHDNYGPPNLLQLREIDKPVVNDNDVLVRVHAASVNPADWHIMRGKPFFIRMMTGLFKPKANRLGMDLAGRVEAVGKNVTQFHPGDEVFAEGDGAFAEYTCVSQAALALKPANLTFEQAAAVPLAGCTALQGLRDKGRLRPGQKVLINGASGGVGTFAVQIAKSLGADVTGVCSTKNVDMVRSIGADQVIDYTREDFACGGRRYDLMFDNVGNRSLSECRRVLAFDGTYVLVGGDADRLGVVARLLKVLLSSRFVSQKMVAMLAKPNQEDMLALKELLGAGKLAPVIDRHYELSEVPEAIHYLEQGHAQGKVVIRV